VRADASLTLMMTMHDQRLRATVLRFLYSWRRSLRKSPSRRTCMNTSSVARLKRISALLVLAFTTGLVVASGAIAQQVPAVDPLQPVCPAGRSPRIDTTQVIVGLEPAKSYLDSAYTDDQHRQMSFYADAIARRFVAPPTLGSVPTLVDLPAYYAEGSDDGGRSVLSGRLILIVKRNGRLKTLAWEYFPMAQPLERAIVRAAQAADSAGDFDDIMRPDNKRTDDTLAIDIRSLPETSSPPFPLMRVRLPGYRGETLATTQKVGKLEYPRSAERMNVGTKGEVRFIVGSDGHAVVAYTQVTRAGWRDFVEPMRKAVASSVYTPATSGGCSVPAWVRQQFTYETAR
jgi:Gram-negative bacterial TonB protein C-terminal